MCDTEKPFYCEKCSTLSDDSVCAECCGKTRAPEKSDICFLAQTDETGKTMYSEILKGNGIEFVCSPVFEGYSMSNAPKYYRFYVKFERYEEAFSLYELIFGGETADTNTNVIDRLVAVTVERPLGSYHPEHPDIRYELNYGYVDGVMGGDGEEQDAYIIGIDCPLPIGSVFEGYVIAVVHRKNDSETKWVVAPVYGGIAPRSGKFTKEQIAVAVNFQEKYFDIEIET